jgi:hypothetical protein
VSFISFSVALCDILCDVYFCVFCLIVVTLPLGKTSFAFQLNNNNNNKTEIAALGDPPC